MHETNKISNIMLIYLCGQVYTLMGTNKCRIIYSKIRLLLIYILCKASFKLQELYIVK